MAAKSSIEWTGFTWNPIVGCSVRSPGCTNCYAMPMAARIERMGGAPHYAGLTTQTRAGPVFNGKVAMAPERTLLEPLRRRKPTTYFVNSMGDLFHEAVPDEWIDRVFAVMALAPQHTFQVLTKRSARMRAWFDERWQPAPAHSITFADGSTIDVTAEREGADRRRQVHIEAEALTLDPELGLGDTENDALWDETDSLKIMQWQWPLPNVWLGVSAEDQRRADERVPDLLATPAAVRFVSAEPLLGPIQFDDYCDGSKFVDWLRGNWWHDGPLDAPGAISRGNPKLDWVIVGGESGKGARPMHPDWARSIRDQCAAAGVPFFFKQWGAWKDGSDFVSDDSVKAVLTDGRVLSADLDSLRAADRDDSVMRKHPTLMRCVGKKAAGRLLDGAEHNAMPKASP